MGIGFTWETMRFCYEKSRKITGFILENMRFCYENPEKSLDLQCKSWGFAMGNSAKPLDLKWKPLDLYGKHEIWVERWVHTIGFFYEIHGIQDGFHVIWTFGPTLINRGVWLSYIPDDRYIILSRGFQQHATAPSWLLAWFCWISHSKISWFPM